MLAFLLATGAILLTAAHGFARDPVVRVETTYDSWDHETLGLNEVTTFLGAALPLGNSARIDILSGQAAASPDAGDNLSGLMNTRARLSYYSERHWVVRGGVSLPTGKTELDASQTATALLLSDRLRGYRGYRLGEGAGMEIGGAYSRQIGAAAVGLGAGYVRKGEYTVIEGQEEYDPGDQLLFTIGTEVGSAAWAWRAHYLFVRYAADQVGGSDAFQLGARNDLRTLVEYRSYAWTARGGVQMIRHAADKVGVDLVEEPRNSHGPEYYVHAELDLLLSPRVTVLLATGGRFLTESEAAAGNGQRFDIGAGTRLRTSDRTSLTLRSRFSRARLTDSEGLEESFSGIQLSAGLDFRP
jgi:hypothetical protein